MANTQEKKLLKLHRQLDVYAGQADSLARAKVLERIATIYEKMEDHAEAIDRYLQVLTIAEELKDHRRIYSVALKLGRLHLLHHLNSRACSYYLLAERNAPSRAKGLLARLHAANVLLLSGDFDEAESLILSAHSEQHPDRALSVRLRATQLMATLRNNQTRYAESLQLLEQCIGMLDEKGRVNIRKSMALSLYNMGLREEAIEKLNEIPRDLLEQSSKRLRMIVYEIYSTCYLELGNFERAFHYQAQFKDLDPDGSILRKGQHHSVKELGFGYTGDLLNHVYNKYKSKINEYVSVNGEITYDGRKCWNVTLTNKEYKIETYTV